MSLFDKSDDEMHFTAKLTAQHGSVVLRFSKEFAEKKGLMKKGLVVEVAEQDGKIIVSPLKK